MIVRTVDWWFRKPNKRDVRVKRRLLALDFVLITELRKPRKAAD